MKKILWVNPHVNWQLDVKNPDGTLTTWTLVHASPGQLRSQGLSGRDFFKIGETYTASFAMARNTNRVTQIEDPPCIESDGQNLYTRERG
jgi:hypothetical protein